MATETVAATSEFKALSDLRPGACMLLNGHVAHVDDLLVRNSGKHAKVHVIGKDVFSGKKVEEIFPSSHTIVECPMLEEKEYQLVDISIDDMEPVWYRLSLLDDFANQKEPLMVPRDNDAVLFSQGLYSEEVMAKARSLKIAFDEEAKKEQKSSRQIAVRVVKAMNREAFKDFGFRDNQTRP